MDTENNVEAKMANNYRNTLSALQVIFATATIFCGSANLFMNSRDVGFTYEVTKLHRSHNSMRSLNGYNNARRWNGYEYAPTRKPIWWPHNSPDWSPKLPNHHTTTEFQTILPPTASPTFAPPKTEMADKFCWDNSGLWGGVLVLMAVLLAVPRTEKRCYAVFQSVSRVCGSLICLGTGVVATFWCTRVLDEMGRFLRDYNSMKTIGRCPSWSFPETCFILKEFNVHLAYGIMGVTIATAILCYLNVALFTLQLVDLIPHPHCFSRFKALQVDPPYRGKSSCGVSCFAGGFVCKFGLFDENGVEQKNVEYKPLIEEGSSDTVDTVTEPGFVA